VDHNTPAVSPLVALERSRSTATATPAAGSWIEAHIGKTVAAAAATIAEALGEFQDGGLTSTTKAAGGSCIFEIYRLRCFLIARFPDFDRLARERGIEELRAATNGEVSSVTIDVLVDGVMDILHKVVRDQLN
jgi:hypothetical protein